jgi:hypothetical protein
VLTETKLIREFRRLNRAYFFNRMSEPSICIRPLERGINGRYLNAKEMGGQGLIIVTTSSAFRGQQFAFDVLLHESVHHYVYEHCCPDNSDHGVVFCDVANAVGRRLGLARITPENYRCWNWPMAVRPVRPQPNG